MQQHSRGRGARSMRAGRTQPALPGVTLPTASIVVQLRHSSAIPQSSISKKQPQHAKRAALKLVSVGLLLVLSYLAMYPLLAGVGNGPLNQFLYAVFPWLPHLFWTSWAVFLVQALQHITIFDLNGGTSSRTFVNGYANLLLALFILTFVLVLIASRVGSKIARERLTSKDRSSLFWIVCIFTGVCGVIFIFAPGVMSQDIFLYATYGRMAAMYNVNPYGVSPTAFAIGILHIKGLSVAHYGPLWIDMTLPIVLAARESVVHILVGFRLLGFVAYLTNAILIWLILAKLKPEMRISGMILFAWNPLVLLVGVSETHYEMVVITFLLLAILFFQRRLFALSWVCILLASLFTVFCLLLLPFFLKLLWKETQMMRGGRRFLWWLALMSLSSIIVVLAFAPYWRGLGLAGFVANAQQMLFQKNAVNSLDAAIVYLPMGYPLFLSWLVAPYHWMILAGITVACLLVFGLWLADTLELVLLCSSWIFLALAVLLPVHWSWFMLVPLVLAIVSTSRYTILLALLLTLGAALEYYCLLWPNVWPNLALVTMGLPLLIWGWTMFFTSTWLMVRPEKTEQQLSKSIKNFRFSRPSWSGRRKHP
jgi:hypothetical protein